MVARARCCPGQCCSQARSPVPDRRCRVTRGTACRTLWLLSTLAALATLLVLWPPSSKLEAYDAGRGPAMAAADMNAAWFPRPPRYATVFITSADARTLPLVSQEALLQVAALVDDVNAMRIAPPSGSPLSGTQWMTMPQVCYQLYASGTCGIMSVTSLWGGPFPGPGNATAALLSDPDVAATLACDPCFAAGSWEPVVARYVLGANVQRNASHVTAVHAFPVTWMLNATAIEAACDSTSPVSAPAMTSGPGTPDGPGVSRRNLGDAREAAGTGSTSDEEANLGPGSPCVAAWEDGFVEYVQQVLAPRFPRLRLVPYTSGTLARYLDGVNDRAVPVMIIGMAGCVLLSYMLLMGGVVVAEENALPAGVAEDSSFDLPTRAQLNAAFRRALWQYTAVLLTMMLCGMLAALFAALLEGGVRFLRQGVSGLAPFALFGLALPQAATTALLWWLRVTTTEAAVVRGVTRSILVTSMMEAAGAAVGAVALPVPAARHVCAALAGGVVGRCVAWCGFLCVPRDTRLPSLLAHPSFSSNSSTSPASSNSSTVVHPSPLKNPCNALTAPPTLRADRWSSRELRVYLGVFAVAVAATAVAATIYIARACPPWASSAPTAWRLSEADLVPQDTPVHASLTAQRELLAVGPPVFVGAALRPQPSGEELGDVEQGLRTPRLHGSSFAAWQWEQVNTFLVGALQQHPAIVDATLGVFDWLGDMQWWWHTCNGTASLPAGQLLGEDEWTARIKTFLTFPCEALCAQCPLLAAVSSATDRSEAQPPCPPSLPPSPATSEGCVSPWAICSTALCLLRAVHARNIVLPASTAQPLPAFRFQAYLQPQTALPALTMVDALAQWQADAQAGLRAAPRTPQTFATSLTVPMQAAVADMRDRVPLVAAFLVGSVFLGSAAVAARSAMTSGHPVARRALFGVAAGAVLTAGTVLPGIAAAATLAKEVGINAIAWPALVLAWLWAVEALLPIAILAAPGAARTRQARSRILAFYGGHMVAGVVSVLLVQGCLTAATPFVLQRFLLQASRTAAWLLLLQAIVLYAVLRWWRNQSRQWTSGEEQQPLLLPGFAADA